MSNPHYPSYPSQPAYPPQPVYPPQTVYPQQYQPQPYPTQQQMPYPGYQPFPPPIQNQPGMGHPVPMGSWNSDANLMNYLANAVSFHVKQKVEVLEILVGWEQGNKYTVKDQDGHKVFYVAEQSECIGRQCCGSRRPFHLQIKDPRGMDALIFDRGLDCSCCCGLFCPDSLSVTTAGGQKLGSVVEEFHLLTPSFSLRDATDRTVLRIEGPFCPMSVLCGDVVFRVLSPEGVSVGTISKHWSGLTRELFTDADFFSMSFPQHLDAAMKAVCLGALFLIDYEYFEDKKNSRAKRLFDF